MGETNGQRETCKKEEREEGGREATAETPGEKARDGEEGRAQGRP